MIPTEQIKELREKTGAGISDIRKALEESGGDTAHAEVILERRLGSIAAKKAGRATRAGLVDAYVHSNGRIGSLVEVFCETDFVARNPQFRELAHDLAMHIAAMDPPDQEALLAQHFVKNESKTIREVIHEAIGKFGESIKVGRFVKFGL